jgi:PhzF family phenazine biosynthesis protein
MKIYQVDAFTNQLFKGNPAGVCVLPIEQMRDDELLQNIAAEMNLSETAFLCKVGTEYQLRWFTPATEVQLCGHATLASAHILWEKEFEHTQDTIQFNTLSGKLFARYKLGKVELDFPEFDTEKVKVQKNINQALGVEPVFTGITRKTIYLIEVMNSEVLKSLEPDFAKLKALGRSFIVTCKSNGKEFDFYSRYFAPAVGINEDPVTGSAHSSLTPYWSKKLGKNILKAYQASKRGGVLECEMAPKGRVLIRGDARTVFEIEMKEENGQAPIINNQEKAEILISKSETNTNN